jgi:hypothetical protein
VPSYLVETYLPRGQAPEELTRGTTRVRFVRSIHVPGDEICFYVFDASSAREAEEAARRAGLDPIRVVEAVSHAATAIPREPTHTEKEES